MAVIVMVAWAIDGTSAAAQSADRHEGYYYPAVSSREVYVSRAQVLKDSTRSRRLGFVSGLTQQLAEQPYAPTYAVFAKGDYAKRLIVVAYGEGQYNTVYRARALFASMTALARLTPLFQELQVEELFTFFDLCKLLGFADITISDGDKFAHQITIK
ncbi:MAG TPA: molybdopterin-guanine dinucleotide biosynthesis protein A [Alphaproteobacteria bacterium]